MNAQEEITTTNKHLGITVFRDVQASKADFYTTDEEGVAKMLRGVKTYPSKAACPLIKLAKFGEQRTDKGSLRHDSNVIEVYGIEADYDAGQVSLSEAQMLLSDHNISGILYTSPSHTPEKPRWRVVCPLSKPYPPLDRERLVARLNGALGGILAPESFVLSQSYYAGRVKGAPYEVAQVRGQFIDLLPQLDSKAVRPEKAGVTRLARIIKVRSDDPVITQLSDKGLVRNMRADGGADIVCPFEHTHTTPRAPGDCTYFPPHTGGFAKGHFKCLHSHCHERTDEDFLNAIGIEQQQREAPRSESPKGGTGPEPLPELPDVPPFKYDFLPGTLRAFVQDISERMQCPPEFAAVGAMVMAGSAIGRRLGIRPKMNDSWTVIPNLWGMLVGRSGVMKSPALAESLAPIKRMEKLAFEKYEEEVKEFAVVEKAEKLRSSQAEAEAKKALSKNKATNVEAMLRPDAELVEPVLTRYIVNDSTPEALCETLKNNPFGVMVERDELIGLLRSMDREGNQEARALYLTAADGDKAFTVDRIMRGSGRHIEGLCVSIVGGIQPGVLAGYVRDTQRSGAGDDGLLQRFGLMVYPDVTDEWKNIDRKPDMEAREAVRSLIERLCNLNPADLGAESEGYGVPFVRFDSAGYGLFVEWLTELEKNLRFGDDHPSIISHLSKYRKMVPALALINHLCEGGTGPVSEAAISRALLFSEFLEAHARRVYSYAARPDFDAAKTILAKLKAGKLPIEFTARDVYRPGWSGLTTPPEAEAAIKVLLDFGWISKKPLPDDREGRPTNVYRADDQAKEAA